MEYRQLGASGLKVPVLSFGTATFGGKGDLFEAFGNTDLRQAKRLIDVCLEFGVTLFDSADVYSQGAAEVFLGQALKGHRDKVLISTKGTFPMGAAANEQGSSRHHLSKAIEASLKRLQTDFIDIYQLHGFDALTPIDEVLRTLEDFVRAGKIRYIGCSNFSGWHLMKSLATADRLGTPRYVAQQIYYSLIGRDYEWELMPLGLDQGVGALVWSPLGWGRLTGKIGRDKGLPQLSRLQSQVSLEKGPQPSDEELFRVLDALAIVARETDRTVPQVAINWLLQRPTVSSVIIGARNEEQLVQNFGAIGWRLTDEHMKRLDDASLKARPYPYWHQAQFPQLNPPVV